MKSFGRLMTALAAIVTVLAVCAVAMPTVLGYGADSLFWDVWGKIYTGDNVQVSVTVKYVEAESAEGEAQEESFFGGNDGIRVVNASALEVYELHCMDAGVTDYAEAFAQGAPLISPAGAEDSVRKLSCSDKNGPLCIWQVTLSNALHPMLPENEMQVYFAVNVPEDQLADVDVTIWIRAQAEGDPVVQVQMAMEGRSENGPRARVSVTQDWGDMITVAAAE